MDYRAAVDWLARYGQYARERASEPGILSQFMHGLVDLPHDVYTGAKTEVSPAETMGWSLNAMTPAMPFAEAGAAGIFGGRLAAEGLPAKKVALGLAETLEKQGFSADDIWQATGWGRGKDGQWRFEINDQNANFKLQPEGTDEFPLPSAFHHPDLYAAYPDLATVDVFAMDKGTGYRGTFIEADPRIRSRVGSIGINEHLAPDVARSTMLHELQHAVQRQEDFARGSNPGRHVDEAAKFAGRSTRSYEAEKLIDQRLLSNIPAQEREALLEAKRKLTEFRGATNPKADPATLYRRVAGETEARNVQTRQDFSDEERVAISPWTTEDVPRSKQTVRQYDFNNATHRQQVIDDFLQKYNSGQLL